jgi:sugar phosphate isomerase/epimerase
MSRLLRRPAHFAPGGATAVEETTSVTLIEEIVAPDEGLLPMPDILERSEAEPFRYCLNTSTLRGHGLPLNELVDIAAAAGYEAIEPWVDEVEKFASEGGDLRDLSARIRDLGLTVEGGIGFFEWIVDYEAQRAKGFEAARHAMGLLARVGGKRVAAPPFGAHVPDAKPLNLLAAAERYRKLLEIGNETGVIPQLEFWGFSKNLSQLSEAALVAIESGHPDANILGDIYHLYKGESPLQGLHLLNASAFKLFHINDYPAIAPEQITDADRVFPGDGVAPLTGLFRALRGIGFEGVLSLELFNPEYYKMDALSVARTGLEKMRECVQKSFD